MGRLPPPISRLARPRKDSTDIAFEEFTRGFWRRVGEKQAESADPQKVQQFIQMFMLKLWNQFQSQQ
jgi:hypothetical protein